MEKYNVNADDFNNYHLIVDTTGVLPEDIYDLIMEKLNLWLENKTFDRIWTKKSGNWESRNN